MTDPSDQELEWREMVHQTEREDFERRRYAKRPLWTIIYGQILATSWQLIVGCSIVALVIYLALQALMRHLSASYTPM